MSATADRTGAPTTFGALVRAAAQRWPEAEALVVPDEQRPGARRTWRALYACAAAHAATLRALGVRDGDRVALLLHNGPEFLEWTSGVVLAGAIAVPLNVRFRGPELAHVLRDSGARLLVRPDATAVGGDAACAPTRHEALEHSPDAELHSCADTALRELHDTDGARTTDVAADLVGIDWPVPTREVPGVDATADAALLMYTSGTTARPKGCLVRHSTWLAAARALVERYALRAGERFWNPLPMFHMAALHPFAACATAGATFVSMTRFDATLAPAQVERERIDVLYAAFPTILADFVNAPGFDAARHPRIRRINCVAPPDTLRRLQAALPHAALTSVYGLTEAGGVVAYGLAEEPLDVRVSTCGRPFDGVDVRIADPSHRPLAAGEVGEIQLRGWCVFDGYWRQPEATAAAFTPDGWLRTGDLGSLDDAGRIRFHGRAKDVLKVGGENVSAVEVESVLALHPAVKLAQVVGAPHARLGEVAVAFVELRPGASATEAEVVEHCRARLASFKLPREVRFVTEWPMSATKIQKYRLRELLAAEARS